MAEQQRIIELPVHLTLDRHVYMSTLSDFLNGRMAKLDVSPGTFTLALLNTNYGEDGEQGFLFKRAEFDINRHKVGQLLSDRAGAYGLTGTYYCCEGKHPDHLRFLNEHFAEHLARRHFREESVLLEASEDEDYYYYHYQYYNSFDSSCDRDEYYKKLNLWENTKFDADKRPKFKCLADYNNLPILFFLKLEPSSDDDTDENACKLKDITLEKVEEKTHPFIVWQVSGRGEELGYAIQMHTLLNTVGDQAGIAIYNDALAFGNYDPREDEIDFKALDGDFVYECKIKPCSCRLYYEKQQRRGKK